MLRGRNMTKSTTNLILSIDMTGKGTALILTTTRSPVVPQVTDFLTTLPVTTVCLTHKLLPPYHLHSLCNKHCPKMKVILSHDLWLSEYPKDFTLV